MEDWLKPENVKLLTQLVLPGFVIVYLRGRLLPNRAVALQEAIIGYVAISFLYQALLAPFDVWLSGPGLTEIRRERRLSAELRHRPRYIGQTFLG